VIYPVDSAIQLLNNWGLNTSGLAFQFPNGVGGGGRLRFFPFLKITSVRVFSKINKYQRKRKCGAPHLDLATSIYYSFMTTLLLIIATVLTQTKGEGMTFLPQQP